MGGSTTCKVRGQTERRDIQETDEKNELGDERGREGKKMEWLREEIMAIRDIAKAKSKTNDKNKKRCSRGKMNGNGKMRQHVEKD